MGLGASAESPLDEDGPNIYELRARVDQVLQFFEVEYDRYAGYVQEPERLESLRIEYYNCVNAIEFQNELLTQLVDALLELRMQLRASEPDERREIVIKLEHTKLDIGDRRNKRFFKEKDRRGLHEVLSPLIADIKMQRLLEEQESEKRQMEDVSTPQTAASRPDVPSSSAEAAWGSARESHATNATSRKRIKHYSDDELTALLRAKDS